MLVQLHKWPFLWHYDRIPRHRLWSSNYKNPDKDHKGCDLRRAFPRLRQIQWGRVLKVKKMLRKFRQITFSWFEKKDHSHLMNILWNQINVWCFPWNWLYKKSCLQWTLISRNFFLKWAIVLWLSNTMEKREISWDWFHEIFVKKVWEYICKSYTQCSGNYGMLLPWHGFITRFPSTWCFTKEKWFDEKQFV